jgi:hypothetical protein
MPVTALMQQFVDDELDRAPELIERTRVGTLQLLRDPKHSALHANERAHHAALVDALASRSAAFGAAFEESLGRRVREELEVVRDPEGRPPSQMGGLQLMDESQVEVDIEISRAIQLIDSTAEWELRELQTFTSTLVGLRHVSADSNPLRPPVYVSALWDAACAVLPSQGQRMIVLRVASGVLAGLLKNAWAAASTRLESMGVEPSAYRTVLLAPGSVPDAPRTRRGPSSAFQVLLADAPAMRSAPTPLSTSRTGGWSGRSEPGVRPESMASRVADLISRIFRTFAADEGVAPEARAVIAKLQDPVLRLVLADDAALQGFEHPAWALIDRVARVGEDFASGDPRQRRLLAFATRLAAELTASDVPDAGSFQHALDQLGEFAAEQWQEQLHGAEAAIEQLQRAERRDRLVPRLSERLIEQMASLRVPAGIRRFVSTNWSRVVAQAMVDHGEQHVTTTRYVKAVDDLLWSLTAQGHPGSRSRLLALLPGLLETLRIGMASIGMAEAEQRVVLDELMPIHTEALRPKAAETDSLSAEEIVRRMREEVIPQEPARSFGDSVIDVASMDTVPAEFMPTGLEEESEPADTLAVGQVRRMFITGRWAHVQLLWRSEQGQYLLFAGEGPGRTHSMTRRALERLQAARLVQPIETQPLVQRTIDTLMHQLALP